MAAATQSSSKETEIGESVTEPFGLVLLFENYFIDLFIYS